MSLMRDLIQNNLINQKGIFCSEFRDWTYADANRYVCLIKEFFEKNNIKKIAVEAYQGFYTYVILIAAYLAKVVFCCYDPVLPPNRKKTILDNYEADIVLSGGTELTSLLSMGKFDIKKQNDLVNEENEFDSGVAYVIYTSGSTGKPKGVIVRSKSLENVVLWGVKKFELTNKDILSQYAPLWFDMSMFDLFGAVTSGAQIVPFATREMKLIPSAYIKSKKITFWNSVPHAFKYIIARGQLCGDYLSSLRIIKLGGDCVSEAIVAAIFKSLPDIKLFITYGPTEGTIFATCLLLLNINYKSYYKHGHIPIGNVINGVKIELINLCDGIGEILLKGDNVSAGYIENENNYNFEVEYSENEIIRIFHTGDYAYLHNDCYYFMGRRDSQVKISGNRIDLLEIETLLARKNILSYSFVVENEIILIYEEMDLINTDYIVGYLRDNLPQYFIPKKIVSLCKLPINSNGKIDTKKVREMIKNGQR